MPPFSTELWQEGAQFKSFKLVKKGQFDEAGVIKILSEDPAQYPGCSGTRTLSDVSTLVQTRAVLTDVESIGSTCPDCSLSSGGRPHPHFGQGAVHRSGRFLHARHHVDC